MADMMYKVTIEEVKWGDKREILYSQQFSELPIEDVVIALNNTQKDILERREGE